MKDPSPGLPAANRPEWGLPAWGLGPVSALFLGGPGKGHCPHHRLGPHYCPVPGWRLVDPWTLTPLSQVSVCVPRRGRGTGTVWFNVLFLSS